MKHSFLAGMLRKLLLLRGYLTPVPLGQSVLYGNFVSCCLHLYYTFYLFTHVYTQLCVCPCFTEFQFPFCYHNTYQDQKQLEEQRVSFLAQISCSQSISKVERSMSSSRSHGRGCLLTGSQGHAQLVFLYSPGLTCLEMVLTQQDGLSHSNS